jgi:hypothetical protein
MPPYENKKYTVIDFEFPPADYPEMTGRAYLELKNSVEGYGDMKSFMCFDAGFRAALKYMEQKFTAHNSEIAPPCTVCGSSDTRYVNAIICDNCASIT